MRAKSIRSWKMLFALVAIFALVMTSASVGLIGAFASGEELFPNGGFESDGGTWSDNGGTPVLSSDEAHSGSKSLKVTNFWARMNVRGEISSPNPLYTNITDGIESGKLYRISMWTKSNEGTTTLGAGFTITGQSGDSWAYPRINLFGGMYCYAYDSTWVNRTSVFGLTKDSATGKIIIYIDGNAETTDITSVGNLDFDLGSNNGGTWFDDISIVETSLTKDVRITLKDGANTVSGKTIVIKDANGTALSTQPDIEEENGVYTVKGLAFNNLTDSYRFSVDGVSGISDGIITALSSAYEMGISEYSATVFVKDEADSEISDAQVTATVGGESVEVTNNGDGSYTINHLYSAVDVVVSKEGLIDKSFRLTAENNAVTVVLAEEKPATVINGNLIANGNFEDILMAGTQEPGKWNAEGGTVSKTTNYQQDGKYGLEIVGTAAYRIDLGSIKTDGTKYILSFAAMTSGSGNISVNMRPTVSSNGGYAYPQTNLVPATALEKSFTEYKVVFSITFDEIAKTVRYNVNGTDSEIINDIASFAAIDFVFSADNGVILDNVVCLTAYDIEFVVRNNGNDVTEGLAFEVVGFDGKAWDVTPVYSNGKWRIENACGNVQITVKQGETVYPLAAFDSRNTSAVIEKGFAFTVTLTDGKDNPVKGATIVARRGSTDLFTMVDNGDGTYSYDAANGTFNLYITLEGYVFPVERNVSSENTAITIKATTSPESDKDENKGKGCGSGLISNIGMTMILAAVAGASLLRKKPY